MRLSCAALPAVLVLTLVTFCTAPAFADAPAPTTTADPNIPISELTLRLKPLTKAELIVEADGWLGLLQGKVRELCETQIATDKATDEEKTQLVERATALGDERVGLTDRINAVLGALERKGGARADYDTYVNAVSGLAVSVQPTDASGLYIVVKKWLLSPQGGVRYGRNILMFLGMLIIFRILAAVLGGIVRRALSAVKTVSQLLRDFTVNTVRKVTMFVGFVVALSMLEVNIGPFLAAMGAAGFIIGFALQGTLSNFAAGIMILLYRPYDLGDMVTVAGQTGVVDSMTLVSTVVKNKDGHIVTIPNSSIWGGTITNLGTPKPA